LFLSQEPEVLIEGPAGTGKTRAVLEKANFLAETYPGIRILFVRKTRKSLTESVLVTWEEKVLWEGHPARTGDASRDNRNHYTYPNGTHIVVGGLDNPDRIMSTEYDVICAFEATELFLDDWEKLNTRRRNNVMPYQQSIADCNPAHSGHWLNKRAGRGVMRRLLSRHEDNPTVTPAYLHALDFLTGARKARLRFGLWVSEEGQIWEEFDARIHVKTSEEVPHLRWYVGSVDWGYRNPGVFQVWGIDGDNSMWRVHEIYRTGEQIDWWADKIADAYGKWPMHTIVCDPAEPGSIEKLNDRLGKVRGRSASRIARKANNSVLAGIDQVKWCLHDPLTKEPRCFLVKDTLRYRDKTREEVDAPMSLEDEIPQYVWRKNEEDKPVKEEPDPLCEDHACDAFRYAAMFVWKKDLTPPGEVPKFPEGTLGHLFGHDLLIPKTLTKRKRKWYDVHSN
jgi:phage terminase large subunit